MMLEDGKRLLNCTPHPVLIKDKNGHWHYLSPSGITPRVDMKSVDAPDLGPFRVVEKRKQTVYGLPPFEEGTYLIVSTFVASVAHNRNDLVVPDNVKRGGDGKPLYAERLARLK
jgi:hypothetical protein